MNALKVSFHKLIARFFFEDKGVTAIEYGLIAGLIALLIIAGVSTLGKNLSLIFGSVATSV